MNKKEYTCDICGKPVGTWVYPIVVKREGKATERFIACEECYTHIKDVQSLATLTEIDKIRRGE